MKRLTLSVLVLTVAALGWIGCGGSREALLSAAERNAYGRVNTVAIAPVNIAARERPRSVLSAAPNMERVLAQKLEAAGFRVIPPETTRAVFDTVATVAQNKYDAGTGDVNLAVMSGVKGDVARRMADLHGADAVVYPEVYLVRADIDGGRAEWDGIEEPVPVGLQDEADASESRVPGALAALSLAVTFVTPDGATLYEERSGLEFVEPLRASQPVPVLFRDQLDETDLFNQPVRVQRAVTRDLDVFLRKKAVAGTLAPGS